MAERCEFCNDEDVVLEHYGFAYCLECAEGALFEGELEIENMKYELESLSKKINEVIEEGKIDG